MKCDNPKVLHVDDDHDILAVTKLALEVVGGLDIIQCSSGRDAVEIAQGSDLDLLLLDVMMPEIDGIETLRRLRDIPGFEQKPAIFMTAKATKADREMLLQCGARSVITKPFDPMNLASEILAVWQGAFQEQIKSQSTD
ncbi:MAG: response regulator [Octadecabacter sp.]|nr:response regulator [Octadecabacter sp.]